MQELGKAEDSIFKERQRNEISFKARMKAKKRREAMFSRETGPKWQPKGQFAPQALGGRGPVGNENIFDEISCLHVHIYSENQIKRDRSRFMKQNTDFQKDISQP